MERHRPLPAGAGGGCCQQCLVTIETRLLGDHSLAIVAEQDGRSANSPVSSVDSALLRAARMLSERVPVLAEFIDQGRCCAKGAGEVGQSSQGSGQSPGQDLGEDERTPHVAQGPGSVRRKQGHQTVDGTNRTVVEDHRDAFEQLGFDLGHVGQRGDDDQRPGVLELGPPTQREPELARVGGTERQMESGAVDGGWRRMDHLPIVAHRSDGTSRCPGGLRRRATTAVGGHWKRAVL